MDLENEDEEDDDEILNPHVKFPLPKLARSGALIASKWNAFLKGGGDTATKLLDNCEEKIPVRSEVTAATARLFQYHGVACHRINQWCYAKKNLKFYPSLAHARHANNERASFFDSLRVAEDMFLDQSQLAQR